MRSAAKYLGISLLAVYIVLLVFAVFQTQVKNISIVFILSGCILSGMYLFLDICKRHQIMLLIMGMISISAGTLLNGIMQKDVHIWHHVIRFLFEAVITVLLY